MIVVAGYSRTGTSIIFECLKRSGLEPGRDQDLGGVKYKSEFLPYFMVNRGLIAYLMEKKPAEVPLRGDDIGSRTIKGAMRQVGDLLHYYGIEILKDPQAAPVTQAWLDVVPFFKNVKFIRTHRDPGEVARSFLRMNQLLAPNGIPGPPLSLEDYANTYQLHEKLWDKTINGHDHIHVQLEVLQVDPEGEGKKISDFLGREFNTELISSEETYAATGRVH